MAADKLLGALGLARRAGALVQGFDEVARTARRGDAALVLLAADLSAGTEKRLRAALPEDLPLCKTALTQQDLTAVTRKPAGVLAVTDTNLAALCRKWT